MRDEDTEPFDLDDESPEARQQEEQIVREYYDSFPKEGDKLFVESDSGARLDARDTPPLSPHGPLPEGADVANIPKDVCWLEIDWWMSLTAAPHEDALVYPILYLYRHNIENEAGEEFALIFPLFTFRVWGAKLEEKLRELGKPTASKACG